MGKYAPYLYHGLIVKVLVNDNSFWLFWRFKTFPHKFRRAHLEIIKADELADFWA